MTVEQFAAPLRVTARCPWWVELMMASGRRRSLGGTLVLASGIRWEPGLVARRAGLKVTDVPADRLARVEWGAGMATFCMRDPIEELSFDHQRWHRGADQPLDRWLASLGFEQRENPVEPGSIVWRRRDEPWPWQSAIAAE